MSSRSSDRLGAAYAVGAYLSWGLFPLYWRQLDHHSSLAILGHRIFWSFAFMVVLLTISRGWGQLLPALREKKTLFALLATTTLISGNWFLFIWAVNSGHITQASLGYYINPLVNIVLARLFLGERLRPLQLGAVALAGAGVLYLIVNMGVIPWVALVLATSFGFYGLVRKVAPVKPLPGLAVETALATPFAILLLFALTSRGDAPLMGTGGKDALLLIGSGVATALPLLWFAAGAMRLRYATMGILQFIAPTCQLGLAVLVYGEPFTRGHGITFSLIGVAAALYLYDEIRGATAVPSAAPAPGG